MLHRVARDSTSHGSHLRPSCSVGVLPGQQCLSSVCGWCLERKLWHCQWQSVPHIRSPWVATLRCWCLWQTGPCLRAQHAEETGPRVLTSDERKGSAPFLLYSPMYRRISFVSRWTSSVSEMLESGRTPANTWLCRVTPRYHAAVSLPMYTVYSTSPLCFSECYTQVAGSSWSLCIDVYQHPNATKTRVYDLWMSHTSVPITGADFTAFTGFVRAAGRCFDDLLAKDWAKVLHGRDWRSRPKQTLMAGKPIWANGRTEQAKKKRYQGFSMSFQFMPS